MIISIPLSSLPLLLAAALIALGFISYVFSARVGVLCIGAGSVIMGAVVLTQLPKGFELQGIVLFGITVVVGLWMMFVAVKNG
ncbi:MAG: hypothetical protein A4E44_02303 [Methanosaeta sp. PtaB.Bin018]|jgi:hypothetical protein|nr:hypothetical protein [Methanothrix sp.]OPX74088.1 MAG: hypothetical protein A4E44_02303 [Methanosaeta sp. PtaB.Bin018]OPY44797.1 MAG: hypothetical protein A4E46_01395 [Methanosaeta sp. PtaU1.Bin016]